jgi:hypothetical protein
MPTKTLSFGELQKMVEGFVKGMEGADGVRLNKDKSEADKVPKANRDKMIKALKSVSAAVSDVCQQPVLAVKFKKP